MGEEDGGSGLEVRRDVALVDALLDVVGQEDGDELRAAHGLGEGLDGEPGVLGGRPGRAPVAQPDLDVDAGVAQVERVRVALAAVAEDGDLAVQEIDVAFAVDGCCHGVPFGTSGVRVEVGARGPWTRGRGRCGPCGRALEAVRAESSSKESSCSGDPTTSKMIESGPRSATRASKTSARAISSARRLGGRVDLDERELALDRLAGLERRDAEDVHELVHLLLDLLERLGGAVDVSVMRETSWRSVGPTARLSMLKPRRANMFETRASAPGRFSTRTETRVRHASTRLLGPSNSMHVGRGRARRDHREALLLGIAARVDDGRPPAGERLLRGRARARPRSRR